MNSTTRRRAALIAAAADGTTTVPADEAPVDEAPDGETVVPGAVMGDGTLTEPGRYAIVCFLPVGSDDSILESEVPPQSDAPPHITQGMFAELTVT